MFGIMLVYLEEHETSIVCLLIVAFFLGVAMCNQIFILLMRESKVYLLYER